MSKASWNLTTTEHNEVRYIVNVQSYFVEQHVLLVENESTS